MGDFLNKILLEGPGSETKNDGLHFDPDPDFLLCLILQSKQAIATLTVCVKSMLIHKMAPRINIK